MMGGVYSLLLKVEIGHVIYFRQGNISGHKTSRSVKLARRFELAIALQKKIPWRNAVTSAGVSEQIGSPEPSPAGRQPEAEMLN